MLPKINSPGKLTSQDCLLADQRQIHLRVKLVGAGRAGSAVSFVPEFSNVDVLNGLASGS